MPRTLKIGLTGGIGAGKSLVLRLLAEKGIPVLQTDRIGHQLLKKKAFARLLVKRFGKAILEKNRISRSKLGTTIFGEPRKQKILGELAHPLIRKEVAAWIRAKEKKWHPLVVVEVPLLFEKGYFRSFDGVLCVSASKAIRKKRLLKRGWNPQEIRRRDKFQWNQLRKNRMAQWVIFNEGGKKDLRHAVHQWLKEIQKRDSNRAPLK